MKDRFKLFELDDGRLFQWPECYLPGCHAGVCLGISSVFCFPHSAEYLNIQPHFVYQIEDLRPWAINSER